MYTLYFSPKACSLASHIALEDAGAVFEAKRVDFGKQEQRAASYLETNPKGRVPSLVCSRGILTETPAILAFIAQSFPDAEMAPLDDPFAFAEMQAFNSYLCSTVHVAHAHRGRGHRWANDPVAIADMQKKVPETMASCFDLIETKLFRGPWAMGSAYTVADPYLFTVSRWLEGDNVDITGYPSVHAHFKRMMDRDSVQRVLAREQNG